MSELRRLGEIINPALSRLETSEGARAYGVWARAAGDPVAANTLPRRFARGLLTVECSSSIWANELTYLAPQLLARMAELEPGNPVERLRFVTARAPFGPPAAGEVRGSADAEEPGGGAVAGGRAGVPTPPAGQGARPFAANTKGRENHQRDAGTGAARKAAEAVGDERLRAAILAALKRPPRRPPPSPQDDPAVNQK